MRIFKLNNRLTIICRFGKVFLVDTTEHRTIGTFESLNRAREAARRNT